MEFIKIYEQFTSEELRLLKELDKTYLVKSTTKLKRFNSYEIDEIYNQIENFNEYIIDYKYTYDINIIPSPKLYNLFYQLNELLDDSSKFKPESIKFNLSIGTNGINEMNINFSLPPALKGHNIGYKIYKCALNHFHFLSTDKRTSLEVYNLWYKLMLDNDLYCFTSNVISGCFHKSISDLKLQLYLNKLKKISKKYKFENEIDMTIEFDTELQNKIILIYGSLDNYKQSD